MGQKDVRPGGPNLLRGWRGRLGLTQSQAASKLGIDCFQVSRYERGAGRPSLVNASKIANATDGAVPFESWIDRAPRRASR